MAYNTGSNGCEYSVTFEIAPPLAVRPGIPFTIPVIVAVRLLSNQVSDHVQLVAHASLRNENHTAAIGLTGPLTSSVRSRNGNTTSGYARLSPLSIAQPGRYRLRVILGAASYNGVTTKVYIDSGVIDVHSRADTVQRPSKYLYIGMELGRSTADNIQVQCRCPNFSVWLVRISIFRWRILRRGRMQRNGWIDG